MEMIELNKIPLSHRKYFVKIERFYPSGFGRTCPMKHVEPQYYVMQRPVGPNGKKYDFSFDDDNWCYCGISFYNILF